MKDLEPWEDLPREVASTTSQAVDDNLRDALARLERALQPGNAYRRRRALRRLAGTAGAFGSVVTVLLGALTIWLTGGGTIAIGFLVGFSVLVGAAGGALLGHLVAPKPQPGPPKDPE